MSEQPPAAPPPSEQPPPEQPKPQPEATQLQPDAKTEELRSEPPPQAQPVAESPQPAPVPPPRAGRARGFVRHRATQLVAVGLLGLILGGGIVALADRDGRGGPDRHRFGDDRGHARFDDRGPDSRWDR